MPRRSRDGRATRSPSGRRAGCGPHLRKDGSRLRAAIHTRDIDFEGRAARLVLAEDVTERERNEERFQLIARATSDAVWDWDFEHRHDVVQRQRLHAVRLQPGEFGADAGGVGGAAASRRPRRGSMASLQRRLNDPDASEWE